MSPEAFRLPGSDRSGIREVVELFYDAVNRKDAEALADLLAENFAPDVVFRWPESLPYGGAVQGVEKLERMLRAAAGAGAPVGATNVELRSVVEMAAADGEDHVVVELSFDWYAPGSSEPVSSGAAEWWRFRDLKVVELKAFYWDTAALLSGGNRQPTA